MKRSIFIALLFLYSCSGRFAAFFDRNYQRWTYPTQCQYDPVLPGAFKGGLKYGAIIGGYKNDTIPIYYRYTLRGWFVVKDHDKRPVTATDLRKTD